MRFCIVGGYYNTSVQVRRLEAGRLSTTREFPFFQTMKRTHVTVETQNCWSMSSTSTDQELDGAVTIIHDAAVISISTRETPDCSRWALMPSVSSFVASLVVLDLHQSRYIVNLHDSVCQLVHLKTLILTHCYKLKSLPDAIGNLTSLEKVSFYSCVHHKCTDASQRFLQGPFTDSDPSLSILTS